MVYDLRAFIGRRTVLDRPIPGYGHANAWALKQGFALIPMTDDLVEAVASRTGRRGPRFADLTSLSDGLAAWAEELSREAPIAYLEIECFGGDCERGAVVWHEGHVVLGPFAFEEDEAPESRRSRVELFYRDQEAFFAVTRARLPRLTTNLALRQIGVVRAESDVDEIAALNLGANRRTDEWRSR